MPDLPTPLAGCPSIGHLLRDRAGRSPNRPFLRFGPTRLTFAEADRRSAQVANRLAELGVGAGDRVGLMMPNGIDYPLLWLGIVRLGAVVVPVNTGYQAGDLRYVLTDAAVRAVIAEAGHQSLLDAVAPECPALEALLLMGAPSRVASRLGEAAAAADFRTQVDQAAPDRGVEHLEAETLATLQYTSGTTGFPKGCMIVHRGWIECGLQFARMAPFTEDDVSVVMTACYYGDFGWNLTLCLLMGMELAILPRFSASTLWASVREMGGTFFYCLGTMPVLLLKQPADPVKDRGHRVKWVSCSGIPADRHAEIERRWGVPWREAYGTTEVGFATATALADTGSVGSGSVGTPLHGYETRLVDPDGRDVAVGEVGEFICRHPWMCRGYWRKPEATAAWLRDGWAHTGDLMRQDERGHFFLVGRTKDMIRRGGENIAAAEVEAILCEHPAVRNAACVAVPDEVRGEEVLAFIQPAGHLPDPAAILAHCRGRLAAFKVPRYLRFVADFPLTPSQRVEKHRLSRDLGGAYDGATKAWR